MGLPCRYTLSASVLMPLVVSAAPCSSAVVPLCCGWVSSGTSVWLIVVCWVFWDPASSTAASVRLITLPLVGAAPLAPRSLSFASFLARVVLRIWSQLVWGGDPRKPNVLQSTTRRCREKPSRNKVEPRQRRKGRRKQTVASRRRWTTWGGKATPFKHTESKSQLTLLLLLRIRR